MLKYVYHGFKNYISNLRLRGSFGVVPSVVFGFNLSTKRSRILCQVIFLIRDTFIPATGVISHAAKSHMLILT
jgi:hypothetical protein